ncbi:hypothetical protein [Pseudidiomarina insulisalsae]|uniref:Uncharacterized protein n=1 Tax=Pseudidiomarina insulisalsae TaxID=575789 RepID=A0A432YMY2_9GAMM|nr:hypothetical protein [Pseudidiomarina insulisalsae]RUO62215.1 hypothetical protein CWI71_05025 [Pseudidiomarina insulisalsae]
MNQLSSLFQTHIADGIAQTYPDLSNAAEFITNSHLDPNNFAMPMTESSASEIRNLLARGSYSTVNDKLKFEPTQTIRGVIRVMVRTHLNRQGVGFVSRNSANKTLAKRVLLPFEGEFDYERMIDHNCYIESWQRAADTNPADYDEIDRRAIEGLKNLRGGQRTNAAVAKHFLGNDNWAKVLTGIYSGLLYLHEHYEFNPDTLWADMNECLGNAQAAKKLVRNVQSGIHQYGTALAGSFLADLGHPGFVKPDTHVISGVAAMLGKDNVSQEEAVHFVYELAEKYSVSPRAIDKIFYIGCSGKLYLYDLEINNSGHFKAKFLSQLRQI